MFISQTMLNYLKEVKHMKVLGLIVEYNPFHNGHIYHIQKAKSLDQFDYTIAVMSSSFVQRGEPAIIDKWKRSQLAIEFGVDLVIELPFVYACQSADYFAKGAIELLAAIGVTDICFGSEDGRISTFIDIATTIFTHQQTYDAYVKNAMKSGLRYADACNQALSHIMGKEIRTPNDLLGLSYVKEIIAHQYPITPHCLQRTNTYHGLDLNNIASASAIRKAIFSYQEYAHTLPHPHLYQNEIYQLQDFFPYLRYQILTSSLKELKNYHMVEEGLEHLLYKHISSCSTIEEFIDCLSSKRYTRPRISRMLIHILMKNTKEDIKNAINVDYLRILAMNQKGREYLSRIKKTCAYVLVPNFARHHHPALDIELKATRLLSLLSSSPETLIHEEFSHIPLIDSFHDEIS